MTITMLTVTNIIILLATLGVNYLGASGFFNGMSQADVSAKYETLITPSGFAFSIWGVIYTLLFATLIYFFVKRNDSAVGELIRLSSGLFIISSLFNMAWIISFSYEKLGISTIFIFGMLFSLMFIIERIYINQANFPSTLAGIAFTLYASWVFIATILNVSLVLVQREWSGFGISTSIWSIIILFVAMAFVLFYLSLYQNAVFPIALAWAFFGIYKSYSSGEFNPAMASTIQGVLLVGIVFFILSSAFTFIKNGYAIFPSTIN